MIDDAIVSVEKWARREFPHYLGEDVGNALATSLDFELTLGQGILAGGVDLVEGIGQFDPLRFAYDPEGAKDAWVGMAQSLGESMFYATPTGMIANPAGAFNHWKNQVTDAVHAEDWSSDRPGFGLGKILFDVGAALVPGARPFGQPKSRRRPWTSPPLRRTHPRRTRRSGRRPRTDRTTRGRNHHQTRQPRRQHSDHAIGRRARRTGHPAGARGSAERAARWGLSYAVAASAGCSHLRRHTRPRLDAE